MALSYDSDTKMMEALSPMIGDYVAWHTQLIRSLFYAGQDEHLPLEELPSSFKVWLADVSALEEGPDLEMVESLKTLYDDMIKAARALLAVSSVGGQGALPDIGLFDSFSNNYEGFIAAIRRLEEDAVRRDSGFDSLTGLRTAGVLHDDLGREMERLSRQGRPFCLAFARLDHASQILAHLGQNDYDEILKTIAGLIKKCMRSFDDAYCLDDGDFIMSLKQTDTKGGAAAVERLRKFLLEEAMTVELENGRMFPVTMSYCVSEPVAGDSVDGVLSDMQEELDRYKNEEEMALEHVEQSPLQRYIKTIDGAE